MAGKRKRRITLRYVATKTRQSATLQRFKVSAFFTSENLTTLQYLPADLSAAGFDDAFEQERNGALLAPSLAL